MSSYSIDTFLGRKRACSRLWNQRKAHKSISSDMYIRVTLGRRGKNDNEENKRELEFKEDGQQYAQVVRMLGNGRLEAYCFDGVTRLGHIRGKMRKKVWVGAGDIILVSLREYQDGKVDIIHKYNADEARSLKAYGELPESARINETTMDLRYVRMATTLLYCVECDDTEALYACGNCDDVYCELCYENQHHSGSRLRHQRDTLNPPNTAVASIELPFDAITTSSSPQEPAKPDGDVGCHTECSMQPEQDLFTLHEARYIPLRLDAHERSLFQILDASLSVSEYTDKVDILSHRPTTKRILSELIELLSTLSGMLLVDNFPSGKRLVENKSLDANAKLFQEMFEIGRRYKTMNPARMRENYGKMIYLLQDSTLPHVLEQTNFSCIRPIQTVFTLLEEKNAVSLLQDPRLSVSASALLSDPQRKRTAMTELIEEYSSESLSEADIRRCVASINDYHSHLIANTSPITKMLDLISTHFDPNQYEPNLSLEVRAGRNGARLSHTHATQYKYVHQSLELWKSITLEMLHLWRSVEDDLLGGGMYRLRDTGQGLQRMQTAPKTSRVMHSILQKVRLKHPGWVGSSVVHLGDHNVPNALLFIDKYTQIARILTPIVQTLEALPSLSQKNETKNLISEAFGGANSLQKIILCDFFKHAFDGSGADNFFDAGSCIDGPIKQIY
uniref:Eukaryotic translation initiation factor 4C n=1 Tax=Albugo laibachii Nc14 TaxID=890382 RepID=F0WW45_9STRA|nr:conserved hypothetical protein [Albugo laibachii Nc14]|eukprot:CCA25653.1 conserved hypothetical protein [Albugo laibachii Nc14]